jgi:hypothetical protein
MTVFAPGSVGYAFGAASPAPVVVERGGAAATATVPVTRSGYGGPVAVEASASQAGLVVTGPTAAVAGTSAAVSVRAAASVMPGDYTVIVRGAVTGLPDVTTTFVARVTAPATPDPIPGTTTRVAYCADDLPFWVGVQNGDGPWTRVPEAAAGQYDVTIGDRGAIATVTRDASSGGYELDVTYLSGAEVGAYARAGCALVGAGSKLVNASVAGLGSGVTATASLGFGLGFAASNGVFSITNVPDGTLALVAARSAVGTAPDRVIVRRGLAPAYGAALPVLDFAGDEAFAPDAATLTVANLGGDEVTAVTGFFTGRLGGGFLGVVGGTSTLRYAGVPAGRVQAGEFNTLSVGASPAGTGGEQRFAYQFFRDVLDQTVTLGARLATPTVTAAPGGGYLRPRLQLASQGEYAALVSALFTQGSGGGSRSASIVRTAGHAGGAAPATWDVTLPDFSALPGFDPGWAPRTGVAPR